MKILEIESFSSAGNKMVKVRKPFTCSCCEKVFPSGTQAMSYKCVNSTDFFELKFCTNCKINVDYKINTVYN